jgi:hypothetical protein
LDALERAGFNHWIIHISLTAQFENELVILTDPLPIPTLSLQKEQFV